MNHRIIARLDIKGPNLVKGIHLEGLRVLGSPEEFAEHYYNNGADELFYQDVVASLYERNSLDDIITRTAKMAFIPLTVGGGLRTIEDINRVLRAGADKICINTAAINNPKFIAEAVKVFGSSTIVVAIEVIKQSGKYLAYTDNGREYTGVDALEWAKKVEELGAGEICLTSVDREGTGLGFDSDLIKNVTTSVSIPVIAHGGAGSKEDIEKVIVESKADAVALASILHYDFVRKNKNPLATKSEGNFEFLKNNSVFKKINPVSLFEIKDYLNAKGIGCRFLMENTNE
ncbi:MAG: imidazole glycerol phosphate synthase cyclase subunit [Bacteroidetes bacterium]|nr:imidazole glycerol phosphate synthase cyclase subunit [Bacteroidota bacterium]